MRVGIVSGVVLLRGEGDSCRLASTGRFGRRTWVQELVGVLVETVQSGQISAVRLEVKAGCDGSAVCSFFVSVVRGTAVRNAGVLASGLEWHWRLKSDSRLALGDE